MNNASYCAKVLLAKETNKCHLGRIGCLWHYRSLWLYWNELWMCRCNSVESLALVLPVPEKLPTGCDFWSHLFALILKIWFWIFCQNKSALKDISAMLGDVRYYLVSCYWSRLCSLHLVLASLVCLKSYLVFLCSTASWPWPLVLFNASVAWKQ